VSVRFLDQPELNTEGKYADFLLTVLAAVAQLERDIMDEKRRDGIAAARAKGVKFGPPTASQRQAGDRGAGAEGERHHHVRDRAPTEARRLDDLQVAG
jgi:DNA invertase Pin-like site-specific DNA recombinase